MHVIQRSEHRRPTRPSALVGTAALAFTAALLASSPATAGAKTKASTSSKKATAAVGKVSVKSASVSGGQLKAAGTVTLPPSLKNTAKNRGRVKVSFSLAGSGKTKQSFSTKIDAKRAFTVTQATKLTGALKLQAQLKIDGKVSGKSASKSFTASSVQSTTTSPTGSTPTGPGTSPTAPGATPTPTPTPAPGADQGTKLVGLFKFDAGKQAVSGEFSGTYFRMINPGGGGVPNNDSTASDKNYTLLRPGTDGGLRSDGFQEPPTPAFAGTDLVNGGPNGDSLATRIVQPQKFFGVNFSIITAATDAQTGTPDPLPSIVAKDGKITGQITAWNAQWNGLSFNQGSPKPDGQYLKTTTPLSGTYDTATKRFVLEWRSYIEGGPFNSFTGAWHLEGTFVPAG